MGWMDAPAYPGAITVLYAVFYAQ